MGSYEGALKASASKFGISFEEYQSNRLKGYKRCILCKTWKCADDFTSDKSRTDGLDSRCRPCKKAYNRNKYTPIPLENRKPVGPPQIVKRDGDKRQARARINHDIVAGIRPDPNDLFCSLCGHKGSELRHEYHHGMGYAPSHHNDVLPLCSTCHHKEHI